MAIYKSVFKDFSEGFAYTAYEENKMKNIVLNIFKIILLLLYLAFLELNKNTIYGWLMALLVIFAYIIFRYTKNMSDLLLLPLCVIALVAIVFISWPPQKLIPAVTVKNPKPSEVISTNYGKVRGVLNKDESVAVFAGIPYAKAPIGDLRWKEPQDPSYYEGTLITDHFMPRSMQQRNLPIYDSIVRLFVYNDYKVSLDDNYTEAVSEDSLYLNIWKPNREVKDLPVMVFVHGGSLKNGTGSASDYNGENLAKEDIIFVTLNYRLGVFGYFADEQLIRESPNNSTGNYGLLDVIKALEWVNKNISDFGGDPNNITVAGESAGSVLVSALCTSPLAEGLFNRVVLESSTVASKVPPHSYRQLETALASGEDLKSRYNVSNVEELRKIDAKDLVKEEDTQHHITVDGYALAEDPYLSYQKGIHNEEAIFHGCNSKESGPFILFGQASLKDYEDKVRYYFGEYTDEVLKLYPATSDQEAKENWALIYGTVFFNYSHYCLNRLAVKNNIPVYEYYFSKENRAIGPWHSGEMIYLYKNITDKTAPYKKVDKELSETMSAYLLNFVKTGDPNGKDLPEWPQNKDSSTLLRFDENIEIIDEKLVDLYAILDKIYGF